MSVRWILPNLGTAPAMSVSASEDTAVLDVRDLVDKGGNTSNAVLEKIEKGAALLRDGKRVIVACDYGISRSNAIAAGIIASVRGISVDAAIREVIARTDEREIKLELLAAVRDAFSPRAELSRTSNRNGPILITGGGGFLGADLTRRMKLEGREVFSLSRQQIDLESSRAELEMLVRQHQISCIIHLANPRVYTSNQALGSTLTILRNTLEVCSLNGIALVFPSSWEVYSGYRATDIIADERLPLFPQGPYGETKWLCENLVNHFRRTTGLKCTLMRMSPIYGPDGTRPKFIYNFVQKAQRGELINTHVYRNAPAGLDLMHRDDAVNALMLASSAGYWGDINIGTGRITSTEQVARWIVEWSNSNSKVGNLSINSDTARVTMDSTLAAEAIGWHPSIEVKQGLQVTVDSYINSTKEKRL